MGALPMRAAGRPQRVLLVGFQDQDNLGLRYLCAAVRAAGHEPDILHLRCRSKIAHRAGSRNRSGCDRAVADLPVHDSAIRRVVEALRAARDSPRHITMGGHYPSFDPEEIL